jgi:hypothetical protein
MRGGCLPPAPAILKALSTEPHGQAPQRGRERRFSKQAPRLPRTPCRCSPRGMRVRRMSPRGDMHPHRACGRTGVRAAQGGHRARPASGRPSRAGRPEAAPTQGMPCGGTGVRAARGGHRARPASGRPQARAAAAAAAAAWPRPAAAPRTVPAPAPQHTSLSRLLAPRMCTGPMRVPDLAGIPAKQVPDFPAGKQRRRRQLVKCAGALHGAPAPAAAPGQAACMLCFVLGVGTIKSKKVP